MEATAQCSIQWDNGAVCRVHRAQKMEVRRQAERRVLRRVGQSNCKGVLPPKTFVVLYQGDEFSENLRDVPAVDFVDDQHEALKLHLFGHGSTVVRFSRLPAFKSQPGNAFQNPRLDLITYPAFPIRLRTNAFNEILIGKGGMEGNELDLAGGTVLVVADLGLGVGIHCHQFVDISPFNDGDRLGHSTVGLTCARWPVQDTVQRSNFSTWKGHG